MQQLFGTGTKLVGDALDAALASMRFHIDDCDDAVLGQSWIERLKEGGDSRGVEIYLHTYAGVGWMEFHSLQHLRSRTRVNTMCIAEFDEGVEKAQYGCVIKSFLRCVHEHERDVIRVAVCDLRQATDLSGGKELFKVPNDLHRARVQGLVREFVDYAVPLQCFASKVCHAECVAAGHTYMWMYNNTLRVLGGELI